MKFKLSSKHIIIAVSIALLAIALIFPNRSANTKDLLKLQSELKADALERAKAQEDAFKKSLQEIRGELLRLEDSIAVVEIKYRKSAENMNIQINKLNLLKNEKPINYSNYTDTALLNRLRSNN